MPLGFNDRISSIRVFGGARLRIFNDDNFSGISGMIDHDVFDLRIFRLPEYPEKTWNDRISSIAVFRERDEWERHDRDHGQRPNPGQPPFQGPPPPGPAAYQGHDPHQGFDGVGACFFSEADFRGERFCLKEGERSSIVPPGFNDRISSIRVFGGARVRVFNDGNFSGINLVVDQDVNNLQGLSLAENPFKNWNDRISSIIVFRGHDDWERNHHQNAPPPPRY
jgi:hypothetical protein